MTASYSPLNGAIVATVFLLSGASSFSQDYSCHANGSVSKIKDKQIASINYNFLDLADTISFEDGGRIVYTYSASGFKRMIKKRDYINHCLYTNYTLRRETGNKLRQRDPNHIE